MCVHQFVLLLVHLERIVIWGDRMEGDGRKALILS